MPKAKKNKSVTRVDVDLEQIGGFGFGRLADVFRVIFALLVVITVLFVAYRGYEKVKGVYLSGFEIHGHEGHVEALMVVEAMSKLKADFQQVPYWFIDMEDVQQAVETLDWVRSAHVRRRWPSELTVALDLEMPVARWGSGFLLCQSGRFIPISTSLEYQNLPEIKVEQIVDAGNSEAPALTINELHAYIEAFNRYQSIAKAHGALLESMKIDVFGRTILGMDSGVAMFLGADSSGKLNQVVSLVKHKYGDDWMNLRTIDARYNNAVAVSQYVKEV